MSEAFQHRCLSDGPPPGGRHLAGGHGHRTLAPREDTWSAQRIGTPVWKVWKGVSV